jgi:hypothetical protein
MRVLAGVSLSLLLLLPDSADAQRRRDNLFSFSPYVGAYRDAYDFEADGSDLGWLIGFKAGHELGARAHLHLNLGYAQANDVGTRPTFLSPVVDNQWVLLTGGGDFALVPGPTTIAVVGDVGMAWRRTTTEDNTSEFDSGWGTYALAAPGLIVRHTFTPRTALWLSLQDYIFDVLEESEHAPALTLGLSFR